MLNEPTSSDSIEKSPYRGVLATDDLAHDSQAYRDEAWFERLTMAKLSPLIVIAFIALLAVFAAAAAAVSYGVHHFARH